MIAPDLDLKLMALADGELDAAEEAALRALIADDIALAERFAEHAEARALLEPAPVAAAKPDPLAAAIRRQAAGTRAEAGARGPGVVVPLPAAAQRGLNPARPVPQPARTWRLPVAATILLCVTAGLGLAIGYRIGPGPAPAASGLLAAPGAQAALQAALDRLPSGQARDWADRDSAGVVKVTGTFRMAGAGLCREYEIAARRPAAEQVFGLACRSAGQWRQRAIISELASEGAIRPASDPRELIDAILQSFGSEAPITGDAELTALRETQP
jgi:anti-sigma factor RsiW